MFRKTGSILYLLLFFLIFFQTAYAQMPADNSQTIRVGYPILSGLTEIGSDGEYSGYTYEYLQEIAQYTGWNYEFVEFEGDLNTAAAESVEMLKRGEIDILGSMLYNDKIAEIYDVPGHSYGITYNTLLVLEENTKINETNYKTISELRVAVLKSAVNKNEELRRFCEINNINLTLIYCTSSKEQKEYLKREEVDAIYSIDLDFISGVRVIAKFAPQPYYFAVTKGRSDIISKLNFAIMKINEADPYFAVNLYEKYFGMKNKDLLLTDEERTYIQEKGTIKVAVLQEDGPVQYYDKELGEYRGISKEIFEYITNKTGLLFDFIPAGNLKEAKKLIASGEIDAVAGIPYDYNLAKDYNLALTRPYASSQVVMIINNTIDTTNLNETRLAVQEELNFVKSHSGPVVNYDTTEQCLKALNAGEADYGYGNGLSVQYYTNQTFYKNLSMIPQLEMNQKICIGLVKPSDVNLITAINKVIRSIPENELQGIIYENTMRLPTKITLTNYIDANPREAILIVLLLSIVIIGILWWFYQNKIKMGKKIAFTNERYMQLCELSNEYIFEYDYNSDCMTLSDKSAETFGCSTIKENIKKKFSNMDDLLDLEYRIYEKLISPSEDRDLLCHMPDGSRRWFQIKAKIICDSENYPIYSIGKLVDIQLEKEEKELLLDRSRKDGLTKIYNSATSHHLIEEQLALDNKGVLFIIDIDLFKDVNDCYGHYIGDQVLMETAHNLMTTFRKEDIVGRLGGDEFIIYIKDNTNIELVDEKCRKLKEKTELIYFNGKETPITLSIGIAFAPENIDFKHLYEMADKALYNVKNNGRNGYKIYEEGL